MLFFVQEFLILGDRKKVNSVKNVLSWLVIKIKLFLLVRFKNKIQLQQKLFIVNQYGSKTRKKWDCLLMLSFIHTHTHTHTFIRFLLKQLKSSQKILFKLIRIFVFKNTIFLCILFKSLWKCFLLLQDLPHFRKKSKF